MNNHKDLISLVKQFLKFGIVGVSNTAISLVIYYIFIWFDKELYIVGNAVGFIVSVLNAYYWNNKYVFKKGEKGDLSFLIRSYLIYGLTFLTSSGLLYLWINHFGINESIAPIINLLITIPLNFLLNKFWVFK